MKDLLFLDTDDELELIPFNYPHPPPGQLRQQITLLTRHGSYIRHQAASWLKRCSHSSFRPPVSAALILRDTYNNNTEIELCHGNHGNDRPNDSNQPLELIIYESLFHTLTIEFVNVDANWSAILGHVKAIQGMPN